MNPVTAPGRRRLLRAVIGLGVAFLLAEGAARILVAWRWTGERVEALAGDPSRVGRFASHPRLPYVLAPSLGPPHDHNALGFRGPDLEREQPPGRHRVACAGGSTTYGWDVRAAEAWPARLEEKLRADGSAWEAVNAGVPGWVSTEVAAALPELVLPLRPEVVVVLTGRNDAFPQGFNGFVEDYSHYRRQGYRFEEANAFHRSLFRWSHLAMVFCTWKGERFGWSGRDHNPAYGSIRFENVPTPAEFARNTADPAHGLTFRRALDAIVAAVRAAGAVPVLCTEAVRPDRLRSGNLFPDPEYQEPFGRRVAANNDLVREVAAATGAILVETSVLASDPTLFLDDCHLTPPGHDRFAALVAAALAGRVGR